MPHPSRARRLRLASALVVPAVALLTACSSGTVDDRRPEPSPAVGRPSPTTTPDAPPSTGPAGTDAAPATGAPTGGLLAMELVGGLCPSGDECRRVVTLDADGSWRTETEAGEVREGAAPADVVAQVAAAVTTADRDRLVATPFTGECGRHVDGTELVVTLRPGEADELVLPGCTYRLPTSGPLAEALARLDELAQA